ncbi:MAG TPA: sensor histidine kinase [Candidatus Acidoferrales bacterium]|nr:sensor histidine kinase [Candidatus Acidoferrales bacterium]
MLFTVSFAWPRYLAWARVALAGAALLFAYVFLPSSSAPVFYGLLGAYLLGGLFLAFRGRSYTGMVGLLALFVDTVCFLIVAGTRVEPMLWLASALFLYLLTEALIFYSTVEVVVIAAVSAVFCAVLPDGSWVLERTVVISGALACAFAATMRRQKSEIARLKERAGDAERAAEKAGENERVRIASDFHDGPLQSFISLQMRLEILRKLFERDFDAGMQDLKQLQTLAQTQIRDLRTFLHSMRPVDVDGANLIATARRAADSFQKESGIPVTFLGTDSPLGLPQEMTLELLQMLREALHNIQKHAGATRVAVAMEKTDRGLEISIDDNGHGFGFAGSYTLEELELLRLGPASLKRRARSLNADLTLESRPGRGAGLKFRIPLQ